MFQHILTSFKGYKAAYLKNDIIAGVMVAALTIPVAMGYAQVAGLPPIYGLYASLLPVLGYAVFASSPQLIFGADASASAITGSALAAFGIAAASGQAIATAALLSFFTAVFLILFAIFRLGRFADYISMPVMSGFLSGIALSIMLGEVPKVLGIPSGGDGFLSNVKAIATGIGGASLLSLALGAGTVALILLGKRLVPKFPAGLMVMALGTALCALLRLDKQGVAVVGDIPRGLPALSLPNFTAADNLGGAAGAGLVVAVVIFADSLMSARSFAARGRYKLDNNREIFAFGVSNLLASLSGCSPTSASLSRTAAAEQYKGKTQMVSLVAVAAIGLVVSFLGGLLYYMPQPLLGGVVLAALAGVVDVKVVRGLWRQSRSEAGIWLASALGVFLVGVLFGVLLGVLLSFIDVILRITKPPQAYLGVIQGREGYYDLATHKRARPLPGVVIYRFSARLFFANFSLFQAGVKQAVAANHPHALIVDASGINSIDVSAAEQLARLLNWLCDQDVVYFFAGQTEALNQQLEDFGLSALAMDGRLTKTVGAALDAYHALPARQGPPEHGRKKRG